MILDIRVRSRGGFRGRIRGRSRIRIGFRLRFRIKETREHPVLVRLSEAVDISAAADRSRERKGAVRSAVDLNQRDAVRGLRARAPDIIHFKRRAPGGVPLHDHLIGLGVIAPKHRVHLDRAAVRLVVSIHGKRRPGERPVSRRSREADTPRVHCESRYLRAFCHRPGGVRPGKRHRDGYPGVGRGRREDALRNEDRVGADRRIRIIRVQRDSRGGEFRILHGAGPAARDRQRDRGVILRPNVTGPAAGVRNLNSRSVSCIF